MSDEQEHDVFDEALIKLIFEGQKIQAIKQYREMTGMALKESKHAVEEIEKTLRAEHPERFVAKAGGCGAMVLIGILGTGASVVPFFI
jgi:ribosomal protein L7/L12